MLLAVALTALLKLHRYKTRIHIYIVRESCKEIEKLIVLKAHHVKKRDYILVLLAEVENFRKDAR